MRSGRRYSHDGTARRLHLNAMPPIPESSPFESSSSRERRLLRKQGHVAALLCLGLSCAFLLSDSSSSGAASRYGSSSTGRTFLAKVVGERQLAEGEGGATARPPLSLAQVPGFGDVDDDDSGRQRRRRAPRILALGGSVAWGGGCLDSPSSQSYPHLLGRLLDTGLGEDRAVVHNLAIRASGSFFPSMCVSSMVRERLREERAERAEARSQDGTKDADWEALRTLRADEATPEEAAEAVTRVTVAEAHHRDSSAPHRRLLDEQGSPSDAEAEDEPDYDVILLDFNMNGRSGLRMLLHRLRRRYPRAVLVYVNLHSLAHPKSKGVKAVPAVVKAMREVGGRMWDWDRLPAGFPRHDASRLDTIDAGIKDMFCEDAHHLSPEGHQHVAWNLERLLTEPDPRPLTLGEYYADNAFRPGLSLKAGAHTVLRRRESYLMGDDPESNDYNFPYAPNEGGRGTWGLGDVCHLWYHTGRMDEGMEARGGEMRLFKPDQQKYAYESRLQTEDEEMTFDFAVEAGDGDNGRTQDNGKEIDMPVYLTHMTYGEPGRYPAVDVVTTTSPLPSSSSEELSSLGSWGEAAAATSTSTRIQLSKPSNPKWAGFHLTEMSAVGTTGPGRRVSLIVSRATTGGAREQEGGAEAEEEPFRAVGVSVCGACAEMGFRDYPKMNTCRKEKCFL